MPFLNGVRMPYDGSMDGSRPTLSKSLEPTYVTGDPTYNDTAYVSLRVCLDHLEETQSC